MASETLYGTKDNCKETVASIHQRITDVDDKHDRKKTYWVGKGMVALVVAFGSIFTGYMYINASIGKQDLIIRENSVTHADKINQNKDLIIKNQKQILMMQKDLEYITTGMLEQKVANKQILSKLDELKK